MISFPYIEDYLEILGGHQAPFDPFNPADPIALARYDASFVSSVSSATFFGVAMTDRQAELATRLILKYRRQFAKLNIDVSSCENPKYRIPIRSFDRSKRIWIEDSSIHLKFPYSQKYVDETREYHKTSEGYSEYDPDNKIWKYGITESNINWLVTWGDINNFEIEEEIRNLFDLIINCESIPYKIELSEDIEMNISNAPDTLLEYIDANLGGLSQDNIVALVDNATTLGYTVEHSLLDRVSKQYGNEIKLFISSKIIHKRRSYNNLQNILSYAQIVNRYPIYIYDPSFYFGIDDLEEYFPGEIIRLPINGKITCNYDLSSAKLIYAAKIPNNWDHAIPLLITTQEMVYGSARTTWLARAERVVTYCDTKLRKVDGIMQISNKGRS